MAPLGDQLPVATSCLATSLGGTPVLSSPRTSSSANTRILSLLEAIGCAVHTVDNGAEALATAQSVRPDAVVVAVELPGISGYEVCHELRAHAGDGLPVVLVSHTRVESVDRIAGFLLGADEYITKPFEPDDLLVRVRSLLRRRGVGAQARLQPTAGAARFNSLTPREREVLALLAQGRNQPAIAHDLVITPKTVATHIQRVLTKLGVHSRAQAVAEAHRLGLASPNVDETHAGSGVPASLHVMIA